MQIPIPTIKRFPSYLRLLKLYKKQGMIHISATMLANELGLKPIQVRKDISCTGIEGRPRIGFEVEALIAMLEEQLGWDNSSEAILVGSGHLGSALARYEGFDGYGLKIIASFDLNTAKVGTFLGEVPVFSMEKLPSFVLENRIHIAIIAVPAQSAQDVADLLVKSGILAIWNFAPVDIKVPGDIVLQRTDLAVSFAVLSAKVKRKMSD
ncbi:MAG: redox-sensing transcriptional repressor Rex [Sphaerochaetaceae bacterium]